MTYGLLYWFGATCLLAHLVVLSCLLSLSIWEERHIREEKKVPALEKEMATTPVFLPGESHGQRSLAGYSPWGRKESDPTDEYHTLSVVLSCLPSLKHLGRETHQGREEGPCLSCLHCSSCAHVPPPSQTRLSIKYVLAPTLRFGGCTLVAKDAMETIGPLFKELRVYAPAA